MNDDIQVGDFVIFNNDWAEASKDVPPLYNLKKGVVERRELREVIMVQENMVALVNPRNQRWGNGFIPSWTEKKYLILIEAP